MKNTSLNSEKFKKRIGNNIRIIRELKNISQAPLCDQINKSQSTLSHYENGQSSTTVFIPMKSMFVWDEDGCLDNDFWESFYL